MVEMAEIVDNGNMVQEHKHNYASKVTGNAGLTLGIIGTALGGLSMLGSGASLFGIGGKCNKPISEANKTVTMTEEDLFNERRAAANELAGTIRHYEGQKNLTRQLTESFFEAYKRDVDNSFNLYKYTRDSKDELNAKIDKVSEQVGIMNAIRPYQDALINSKIDMNALLAQYNLDMKTCKCIYGVVTLPNDPTVTGYPSQQSGCNCNG